MIESDAVQVFDNGGPNNAHAEPTIAAAQAGKHVFCEKPLARTAAEAKTMLDAAEKAGVKHMVAFNYRFVPAIMQARKLIESGKLGKIYHWRAVYLQEWGMDPNMPISWRFQKDVAGSGSLGDLGAHIIDLARFLVGEPKQVMGMTQNWLPERPDGSGKMVKSDVDDGVVVADRVRGRRIGHGRGVALLPRSQELQQLRDQRRKRLDPVQPGTAQRVERLLEGRRPEGNAGLPQRADQRGLPSLSGRTGGRTVTCSAGSTRLCTSSSHFFDAIVNDKPVDPYGATFVDGYRNAVICDAILASAQSGRAVDVKY